MGEYINKVVVFCGSSLGNDPKIIQETERLGALLGQNGFNLIYGGGTSGLMGVVSKAALENGAAVQGVIPEIFNKAGAKEQGTLEGADNHIVENMMIRKDRMIFMADAGIILPGGFGTLDEIYQMAVEQQLKTYAEPETKLQPVIVVNIDGYFDGMKIMADKMVEKGYLDPDHAKFIQYVDNADEAIELLKSFDERKPVPAKNYQSFVPASAPAPAMV